MSDLTSSGYHQITIQEGAAPFLMARVTNKAGAAIVQAGITSIAATITNITADTTVIDATALNKATVWFDTYQTTAEWTEDSTGYNFGWQTLSSYFSTPTFDRNTRFKVEVWVTPTSGEIFTAGWWLVIVNKSIVPVA